MNNQEAFDGAAKHLLTMGKPSAAATGQCYYRRNGGMCAIGALIPDELYKPEMDNLDFDTDIRAQLKRFKELSELFDGVDTHLLADIQGVHDHIVLMRSSQTVSAENNTAPFTEEELASIRGQLAYIADGYSLDTSVLKAVQ